MYAVAYADLSDNLQEITFIDEASPCDAMREVLAQKGFSDIPDGDDEDEIGEWAFDQDVLIGVKEVP